MRLPGTPHECGPLLELGWLSRQLDLGHPVDEGVDTIAVERIIGSVQRGRDFDACWHPLNDSLTKRLSDVEAANPSALDEPIDVIRVDRAYFVIDGHKRVALARRTGRAYLDARVRHAPSAYAVSPEIDEDAILRTARESEFRRHSGIASALPDVRFALTEIDGYGELFGSVQVHAIEMSERLGRVVTRDELAHDWYETVYVPTVADARARIGSLVASSTDADIFLAIHRQRVAWWGSECDAVECAAQDLLVERQMAAAREGTLLGWLRRKGQGPGATGGLLLPLAEADATAQVPAPPSR
jgi:hypothetical protein